MKLRILFANKFFHPDGGSETLSFEIMENLQRMGHEVIPFSMKHPSNLPTPYSKYFVTEVNYQDQTGSLVRKLKIAKSLVYSWEASRKMKMLLDDCHPQIAHFQDTSYQISPSVLPALKKKGVPVIMTLNDLMMFFSSYPFSQGEPVNEEAEGKSFYQAIKHRCIHNHLLFNMLGAMERYVPKWWRVDFESIALFITSSQFSKCKMVEHGIPEDKILVLPNCIDPSSNCSTAQEDGYILFVGRLTEAGGILTLVEAIKKVPRIKLVIAGEGELKEKILNIRRMGKLDNIYLAGPDEGNTSEELIRGARFTIFPGTYYHDCPMFLLKSLAFAKPVIASNTGSIPEFVDDGTDGLLFEPGNPADLAEKISYLCRKPVLTKKMGVAGHLKIENKFSSGNYYPQLLEIYKNLLEGNKVKDNYHN